MQKLPLLSCVLAGSMLAGQANADEQPWKVYSSLDLFAYSEPVSIDQFATDFQDDLEDGETAFTHDQFELGVQWRGFRIGYVHRFDYVTEFTEDTAFYHHATKNNIAIPTDRNYNLLLDVERLEAKGFKVGYEWNFHEGMTLDIAASYYTDLSQLQSGFAGASGDLEPIDDALIAQAQTIIDGLSFTNRDLQPLINLAQDIQARVAVDYAYDEPKFDEPLYREPVLIGEPNPPLTGVDFTEPDGTGYSVDIGFNWQVNDRLNVNVELIDIANEFSWDNAPTTQVSFDLNAFVIDALNVAQDAVNGEIVRPNDVITRNLNVIIVNEDFDQELDERYDVEVNYDLNYQLNLFGWEPNVGVMGGWYSTANQEFPRIGVSLDRKLNIGYDIGGEAISLSYVGKYGYFSIISDDFGYNDARTFGITAGLNYSF